MVVSRICNRNVNWNPNTAGDGSVIHAKFPLFTIVLFQSFNVGSTFACLQHHGRKAQRSMNLEQLG